MITFGTRMVYNNLKVLHPTAEAEAKRIVKETAVRVQQTAQNSMRAGKTGKVYRIKGGRSHQASAPGEPPAVRLGTLISSIKVKMIGPLTAIVYTNVIHGLILEVGGALLAARPWLRPAAMANMRQFYEEIRRLPQRWRFR